ncbi:hypothetical protein E8E12_010291 [Didymella heteroderae]|uniref:Uncharacterized protein n=1 Tax=Didymella heteroderae TaxID=1769908 RepID=A0A9P4WYR8_9PLEO|nr:hypothetical protein E8E12_010291 [Didymella heteroderae]
MRFSLSITILALLPLALCVPSTKIMDADAIDTLDNRAVEPALVPTADDTAPSGLMVQSFEAWMPLPAFKRSMKSRAYFTVSMMPPVPGWSTTCFTTTNKALCDPNVWYNCTNPAENDRVMFRLGHDLTSVDIKRTWTYEGTTMTATASQPAEWNESVNPRFQNVTVSQWGKCYKRPQGWKFDYQSMVGLPSQQSV